MNSRRGHGGSGDADHAAVSAKGSELQAFIQVYSHSDVWNADKTAFYYAMAPDRTALEHPILPGRNKAKVRLTFLGCCNATGTEKMSLLLIGTARHPRAFELKTGQELGFDYWNSKKAWRNTTPFYAWLLCFDEYIA